MKKSVLGKSVKDIVNSQYELGMDNELKEFEWYKP